jgi:hypothetical protein
MFFLFPNIDYYASLSNFFEDVDKESVGSPTDAHANYDLCSILSNQSLYRNKNMGYIYNKPNPDHNNVSDTSALPTVATTNHPRKIRLHRYRVQRRHTYQVSLSPLVVLEIGWAAAAEEYQCGYRLLPSLEQERQLPMPVALFHKVIFSFCYLLS